MKTARAKPDQAPKPLPTPVPWRVSESDPTVILGGRYNLPLAQVILPSSGAWDGQLAEQLESNARRIVHAVNNHDEMLAALRDIENTTRAMAGNPHWEALAQKIQKHARAALTKAEGKY